jgi:hypothetical protein
MVVMKLLSLNLLLSVLLLFNVSIYAQTARVNPDILPIIEAEGSVLVLVSLAVEFNFEPEDEGRQTRSLKVPDEPVELTRSEKLQRISTAIAPVQQEVLEALNELPAGSFELDYQYKYLASLALEINLQAFELLRHHEKVVAIQLNLEGQASLKKSKEIMKVTNNATDNTRQFFTETGDGVTVAVFDTGIDTNHSDFNDNAIVAQQCFVSNNGKCPNNDTEDTSAEDDQGHGSHVSGIITSPEGIAPDSKIVAVKVIDNTKSFNLTDLTKGIEWLVTYVNDGNSVNAINMSLGLSNKFSDQKLCDEAVPAVTTIFNQFANELNIISFAASGNNSDTTEIDWPSCLSDVISVGNSNDSDNLHSSGNRGVLLDVVAPGVDINSTKMGGGHKEDTGTSMSSPMAAGVAALMLEKKTDLSPYAIRQILIDTADKPAGTSPYPRINAKAALDALGSSTPILLVQNNSKPIFENDSLLFSVSKNTTLNLPLEFKNIGTGILNITGEPSLNTKYSLSSNIAGDIAAGTKVDSTLQVDTSSVGRYEQEIVINNNTSQNSYNFTITTCVTEFPFIPDFSNSDTTDCFVLIDNSGPTFTPTAWEFNSNNTAIQASDTRNDWLITPAIKLESQDSILRFTATTADDKATFSVLISTTGNNPDSFNDLVDDSGTPSQTLYMTTDSSNSPNSPKTYEYDLTDYANQTVYLAIHAQSDGLGNLTIKDFEVTDETAPNFTNSTPTISDINETSFNLNVRLNEASTVYYVVSTNDNEPNLEQLKAGKDGSDTTTNVEASGHFEVTTFNADTVENVNTLDDDITYYVYVAAENAADVATTIQSTNIKTPLDTPPTFINGYPKFAEIEDISADLSLRIDEIGDVYLVVLDDGATEPTAAQIKAGKDANDANVAANRKHTETFTTANAEQTVTLNSLTPSTSYDIYLVAEDKRNNLTADANIQKLDLTTRAPFLTLNLAQSSVVENAGSISATVTRSAGGGTTGDLEVKLVNNAPSQINMPPKVTILNGETSVSFNIQIKNNGTYTGSRTVQINATEDSYEQATASFEITEDEVEEESSVFTQPPPQPDYVAVFIGSPNGRVISEPEGIDCNKGEGSCWHIFPRIDPETGKTTRLTLNTIAPEGLYFDSWAGDSDCHDNKLYLNDTKACLAYFYGIRGYQAQNNPIDDVSTTQQQTAYLSNVRFTGLINQSNNIISQFDLPTTQTLLFTATANDTQVDPMLTLETNDYLIAQNDDWKQAINYAALEETIFLENDRSAALLQSLNSDIYSITMTAIQSGVATLAIQPQSKDARLSQISTRLLLTENTTVNFSLQNVVDTQTVLIKTWGTTPDIDPAMQLTFNNRVLDSNDNWQQTMRVNEIPVDKQPNSLNDAALLVDLTNADYSLYLSTANNMMGQIVVEIQLLTDEN